MKKKKKKNKKKKKPIPIKLQLMQDKINLNSGKLRNPKKLILKKINSHSWIDHKISDNQNLFSRELNITSKDIEHDGWFTRKIRIYPSRLQKRILINWMNKYIAMYNHTSYYLRNGYFHYKHSNCKYPITNLTKLKKLFYNHKMKILNSNPVTYNKQTFKMKKRKIPSFYKEKAYKNKRNVMGRKGIHVINKKRKMVIYNIKKEIYCNSHVLDYAINDALNRYNTCMENLKNGTIRSFKLRGIKYTKPIKIVKFEKYCAKKDGFAISALGKMYSEIPKFDYDKNTRTITIIQYNSKTNDFFMLIKYKKKDKSNRPPYSEKENIGSIDPGIRSMLTVYANNKIEEIGTNCKQKIKRQLKRIDRINNNEMIDKKKRQKITNKKYEKIKNQVNDMHWKIAHYLTDNYKTIVIGNFSTRNMGKKIPKMIKRIGGMLSFFKFREKLKYLCKYKNTEYIKIDEAYTSKCCSECGNYKKDLGANKIYNCKECKMKIDRDINGAKNILMLSL